jgi:hypothetical protein
MSLRLAVARQAGMDETIDAKIQRYESSDLSERHKVALRLTDAIVVYPRRLSEELRGQLHATFTPAEIVEVMLDVVSWSKQKIPVALGTDRIVDEAGFTPLAFDEAGHAVYAGKS